MNKKYILEKLKAIEKELNKTPTDKSYIMEKINHIITDIKEKGEN